MAPLSEAQKKRVTSAVHIAEHVDTLDRIFPEVTLGNDNSDKISHAHSVLKSQLRRIEANSSKYVVVGLEKAGKSTFLNSLLGADLLPASGERCTYAVTSIAAKKGEFSVTITPQLCSFPQFQARLEDLEVAAKSGLPGAKAASDDLVRVKQLRPKIEALIHGRDKIVAQVGVKSLAFSGMPINDIEVARSCLKTVAANPETAFAMQEVRVDVTSPFFETTSTGSFELVDLPGLDSGLSMHKDLARATMADADAIIFVQNITNPDLQEAATTLLDYADQGDVLSFKEKIFVFLSRADQQTDHVVNANFEKASNQWKKYGVAQDNIYAGSAVGHLLRNPQALSKETLAVFLGRAAESSGADLGALIRSFDDGLKRVMGLYAERWGRKDHAGVREFLIRLDRFQANEQASNVTRRVEECIKTIKDASRDFIQGLASSLNKSAASLEAAQLDDRVLFQMFLDAYVSDATGTIRNSVYNSLEGQKDVAKKYDDQIGEQGNRSKAIRRLHVGFGRGSSGSRRLFSVVLSGWRWPWSIASG